MNPPQPPGPDLAGWIARGAQGDEAACSALFHHFYLAVFRLSLALLNDLGDAEEVAQDTFVYALRRLAHFDPARSAFRTSPAAVPREVDAALERRGLRRQLWEALQSLPGPLREAVVLRYLGEMRYREVAETLGCNAKTAESRVRLGVGRMRRHFETAEVEVEHALAELATW
jgi:RNA polymerase sigma-70 factor (ECF subfamily)